MRLQFVGMWFGAVLFSGCGGGGDNADASSSASYTVTVAASQPVVISGEALTVELTGVVDSRCPAGAMCITAGEARIALRVTQAGHASGPVAVSSDGSGVAATYRSFTISLTDLQPQPNSGLLGQLPLSAYRATLRIERPAAAAS